LDEVLKVFIDFKDACDLVWRGVLYNIPIEFSYFGNVNRTEVSIV